MRNSPRWRTGSAWRRRRASRGRPRSSTAFGGGGAAVPSDGDWRVGAGNGGRIRVRGGSVRPGHGAVFGPVETERLVIFGGGVPVALPEVDGYRWDAAAIASTEPDAPLQELQTPDADGGGAVRLKRLAGEGWLAVVDGPLNFVRSRDLTVVGLVKTHHRALLRARRARSGRQSSLCGERTPVFVLGSDRYSCYVRIACPGRARARGSESCESRCRSPSDSRSPAPPSTRWPACCPAMPGSRTVILARRRTCSRSGRWRSSCATASARAPGRPRGPHAVDLYDGQAAA